MLAISFAVMGARERSFLSCRAYGKLGITAVIRRAEAVLQAERMMRSSMRPSLTSEGVGDARTKTEPKKSVDGRKLQICAAYTIFITNRFTNGYRSLLVRILHDHNLGKLDA